MSLIQDFEGYLLHEKRFSQHTVTAYMKDVQQFTDILAISSDQEIKEITHRSVRSFVVELVENGLENSSVNRKLSSIKTFFRYLRQQKVLDHNPAQKVQSLKQKKVLPQFVPENQLWDNKIFEQEEDVFLRTQDELILEMFYQTGIRLSELIHLKEKDVQADKIKVLGKRNKERLIPISNKLYDLILLFRSIKNDLALSTSTLFCSKQGKKLAPKFVYTRVNLYLTIATNLSKKSPHILRHTFATHMLNNGASLESIKKLLGHTDLSATQIYTHNSFKQIKSIYEQSHPRGASL